jgi:peroxiredoxin
MRIISGLLLTLVLCAGAFAQQNLRPGQTAPTFTAASLDGKLYDLNKLKGKVVVVTFWSTRCAICHSELPKLNQLADRFRGQDVVFLGLTMENEGKVNSYIRNNPFRFNILPNSFGVLLQYADRDRKGNIEMGFPAYFVLDQNGSIDYRASGWDKTPSLNSSIGKLLAGAGQANRMTASAGSSLPK